MKGRCRHPLSSDGCHDKLPGTHLEAELSTPSLVDPTPSLKVPQPGTKAQEDSGGVLHICGSTWTLSLNPNKPLEDAPPVAPSVATDSKQDGTPLPWQAGSSRSSQDRGSAGKCNGRHHRSPSRERGRGKGRGKRTSSKRQGQKRPSQSTEPSIEHRSKQSTEQRSETSTEQGSSQSSEGAHTPPQNKRRKSSSEGKKKSKC